MSVFHNKKSIFYNKKSDFRSSKYDFLSKKSNFYDKKSDFQMFEIFEENKKAFFWQTMFVGHSNFFQKHKVSIYLQNKKS